MNTFEYLSVFISIVVGLGVVRVLGGVVTILDRRHRGSYWVHTAWVAWFVFFLPYFWWFTFDWRRVTTWTLPLFLFVVAYAMLTYLVTAVLVPTRDEDLDDLEGYFFRVRPPLFLLLALVNTVDVFDSLLKPGNMADVGPSFLPVMAVLIGGNLVAAKVADRRVQAAWVITHHLLVLVFSLGLWADVFSSG